MVIETQRCKIRYFEEKDIDAFMTYRNDEDWMKYQSFKNLTKEEYKKHLLGKYDLNDGIQLAVTDKTTDNLLGDIYVKQEGRDCWIGFSISPVYSGKGYMFEVLSAFIQWKSEDDDVKIFAGSLPENIPSQRLLKKLGFEFVRSDSENNENIYMLHR